MSTIRTFKVDALRLSEQLLANIQSRMLGVEAAERRLHELHDAVLSDEDKASAASAMASAHVALTSLRKTTEHLEKIQERAMRRLANA